jgi:hypothetical protein
MSGTLDKQDGREDETEVKKEQEKDMEGLDENKKEELEHEETLVKEEEEEEEEEGVKKGEEGVKKEEEDVKKEEEGAKESKTSISDVYDSFVEKKVQHDVFKYWHLFESEHIQYAINSDKTKLFQTGMFSPY